MASYVLFKWIRYKLVFTNHSLERMEERWIKFGELINSIEKFDISYVKYWKEIVEKQEKVGNIRTVFTIKTKNVILITTMILWK